MIHPSFNPAVSTEAAGGRVLFRTFATAPYTWASPTPGEVVPDAFEEGEIRAEIEARGAITDVVVVIVARRDLAKAYVPYFRATWRRKWFGIAKWRSKILRSYSDPRALLDFVHNRLGFAGTRIAFLTEEDPLARELLGSTRADGRKVRRSPSS